MNIIRIRAILWRMRFILVAMTVCAIVAGILEGLSEMSPATRPVLVTAEALPAGIELSASNIKVANVAVALIPEGVLTDASTALDKVLVTALPRGMPIAASSLLSNDFLKSAPPGYAIVAISLASEGTQTLAEPGSTVALYATSTETSEQKTTPLVSRAIIMGVGAEESGGSMISSNEKAQTFYVAVPNSDVGHVLAENGRGLQAALLN